MTTITKEAYFHRFAIWAILTLIFAFSAASQTITVTGRVAESNGRPVRNATITAVTLCGEVSQGLSNQFGYYQLAIRSDCVWFMVSARHKQFWLFMPLAIEIYNIPSKESSHISDINFRAVPFCTGKDCEL